MATSNHRAAYAILIGNSAPSVRRRKVGRQTKDAKPTLARIELVSFAVCMLLLAVTAYAILIHGPMVARRWPTVQGTIQSVKVTSKWFSPTHESGANWHYQVRIVYGFQVDGKRYQGNRHGQSGGWKGNKKSATSLAARYVRGAPITVHHHPTHPRRSMVDPHVGTVVWFIVLLPMALAAVLLWAAVRV